MNELAKKKLHAQHLLEERLRLRLRSIYEQALVEGDPEYCVFETTKVLEEFLVAAGFEKIAPLVTRNLKLN